MFALGANFAKTGLVYGCLLPCVEINLNGIHFQFLQFGRLKHQQMKNFYFMKIEKKPFVGTLKKKNKTFYFKIVFYTFYLKRSNEVFRRTIIIRLFVVFVSNSSYACKYVIEFLYWRVENITKSRCFI